MNTAHLLCFLVFCSSFHDGRDIVRESKLLERLGDVVTCNCLFCFLLRDLICLRGDEGDELDAALYKKVPGLSGKCYAALCWENLTDNLLDSGCGAWISYRSR